jgi:antitoxin VapB
MREGQRGFELLPLVSTCDFEFWPDSKSATLKAYIRGMAMIHLSQETVALARRLATARRPSMEDAIQQAIEQSAREVGVVSEVWKPRDQSPNAVAARKAGIDRIVKEIAKLPVLDPRSPREIMDDLNVP